MSPKETRLQTVYDLRACLQTFFRYENFRFIAKIVKNEKEYR